MGEDAGVLAGGLTRREVIRRGAAGGALLWAAPAVTRLGGTAFAETPAPGCTECAMCPQPVCGAGCGCVINVDNQDCFCHQGTPCGQLQPCTATSDCPDGWVCAKSCCGDATLCLPPCGTVVQAAGALAVQGADTMWSTGARN